jgi:hypothetical protein
MKNLVLATNPHWVILQDLSYLIASSRGFFSYFTYGPRSSIPKWHNCFPNVLGVFSMSIVFVRTSEVAGPHNKALTHLLTRRIKLVEALK